MSDFSLFSLFTAGLACMIPLASAYTKPVGASPKGNPISEPGLNDLVPAGKGFTVQWKPTTQGTVTLVLLKGPSTDAEPQYAIAENIPNTGTYVWTPSKDLQPTQDAEGYGLQLIDDKTGQYQYTTQFGISNPDWKPTDDNSTTNTTTTDSPWNHTPASWTTTKTPATTPTPKVTTTAVPTGTASATTGWNPHNVTIVSPTGSMTVPATLKSSPTTLSTQAAAVSSTAHPSPSGPTQGNGASTLATSFAGLVIAAAAAVFVL